MRVSVTWILAVCALCACASGRDVGDASAGGGPGDLRQNDPNAAACMAAVQQSSSVGCEYYAVHMDGGFGADNGCFVVFLANTSPRPAHVKVSFAGVDVDLAGHATIPRGNGKHITYEDVDLAAGVAPGEVAALFLAGLPNPGSPEDGNKAPNSPVACPVAPALSSLTQLHGTGRGAAFRVKTDAPVVAYQMLPYGGGNAAVTGATLLLPTSAYGTNYVAADAYGGTGTVTGTTQSSMDIVAAEDDTHVTLTPVADVNAGPGVEPVKAGAQAGYTLKAGEVLQFTQQKELTGSVLLADKPVTVFAGNPCTNVPSTTPYCDHAEQQIPPVQALGSEYLAVTYRPRTDKPEHPPWRLIGAVDGTTLAYSAAVGGPASVGRGELVEFQTGTPFRVRSQDKDHPFLLIGSMSSATNAGGDGYGDADIVRVVPVGQYMDRYVFFTDPTYPETNLVVTRTRGADGFADVTLDCAGTLGGWTPIDDAHEFTRVDLVRHDFEPQGGCDNGRHEMTSKSPFGLTVWGWGSPETSTYTGYVSYGYPAGENVKKLTDVIVPP